MTSISLRERLTEARKRAGFTQRELATASGVSYSLIRKLEQGERSDTRMETVRRLAAALRIPTTHLLAAAVEHGPDAETAEMWAPVRQALMSPGRDNVHEAPTLAGVRAAVDAALPLAPAAQYGRLAQILPDLIRDAQTLADIDPEGRAVHTRLMQLVGTALVQHRHFDLAEIVLEQARDRASDRLQATALVSTQCWLLLRRGRLEDSRTLAVHWADETEPRLSRATPGELAAWGWMLMRAAAAAGRDNREGEAQEALRMARAAAEAMPSGEAASAMLQPGTLPGTFSSATVRRKLAEHAAVTDRPSEVLDLAATIPASSSNDNHRHLLDVAHAQTALRKYPQAVNTLMGIYRTSPEWLPQQRYAQDILQQVVRRRRTLTPEMRQLAGALRLPL